MQLQLNKPIEGYLKPEAIDAIMILHKLGIDPDLALEILSTMCDESDLYEL